MQGICARAAGWICAAFALMVTMTVSAEEPHGMKNNQSVEGHFMPGPFVEPADELRKWLLQQQERSGKDGVRLRIRLPVVVHFQNSNSWGVESAHVGCDIADSNKGLRLRLDNTATSMSLNDLLRMRCVSNAGACALWLEGFSGQLVPLHETEQNRGVGDNGAWFAVLRILETIPQGTACVQEARALVEER